MLLDAAPFCCFLFLFAAVVLGCCLLLLVAVLFCSLLARYAVSLLVAFVIIGPCLPLFVFAHFAVAHRLLLLRTFSSDFVVCRCPSFAAVVSFRRLCCLLSKFLFWVVLACRRLLCVVAECRCLLVRCRCLPRMAAVCWFCMLLVAACCYLLSLIVVRFCLSLATAVGCLLHLLVLGWSYWLMLGVVVCCCC